MAHCVGIITAMELEFRYASKAFHVKTIKREKGFKIALSSSNGNDIVLIKSGVGLKKANEAVKILLNNFNIGFVLNIGIAGGIKSDLKIGDIIIGNQLFICDGTIDQQIDHKQNVPNNITNDIIENMLKREEYPCHYGAIVSVRKPVFCNKRKKDINEKYNAYAVDMEAASIAEVCSEFKKPFISIKSISDFADESSGFYEDLYTDTGKIKSIKALSFIIFHPIVTFSNARKIIKNIHFALCRLQFFTKSAFIGKIF